MQHQQNKWSSINQPDPQKSPFSGEPNPSGAPFQMSHGIDNQDVDQVYNNFGGDISSIIIDAEDAA